MKHNLKVTLILISFFVASQLVGLALVSQDIQVIQTSEGITQVVHSETVIGPRPEIQGAETFILVVFSFLLGTGLLLLLIRFRKVGLWKFMFFLAVFMTVAVALGIVMRAEFAFIIAFVLAYVKIFRSNQTVHNISEVLMYAGLVLVFAPLFNLFWISILLIVISFYDIYAVWKSGHMVKMAEAIMKEKVFAGFSISYRPQDKKVKTQKTKSVSKKSKKKKGSEEQISQAVLGGGDIAFPLLFSAVVMEFLINTMHLAKEIALFKVFIITAFVTAALLFLLFWGKKGKFYPAMPFVSIGCFAGLTLVLLI